ncbi:MAG: DUF928 domain-containing protein [Rivularia sp. (in: Bacteria)]|nr:DUF928 domain-containing protein [Rivularia sp. MS3]
MKTNWKKIKITAALLASILVNLTFYKAIKAQSLSSSSSSISFTAPPPPPNRSGAGNRGAAASRGCGSDTQSVMALVPDYEETIKVQGDSIPVTKIWGLTTSNYPTFWFFVPYDKSSITKMEFVIKDESQKPSKTVYRTLLNKPDKPGIISVSTNKAIKPLQADKTNYHWFLKVKYKCSPEKPEQLEAVDGWIQRTKLDSTFTQRLASATPLQRAALYAEKGIWYDSLTALAELRLSKPQNASLMAGWESLLKSEDLDSFANYPLINCCQTTSQISASE